MTENEERQLAVTLFPELSDVVLDMNNCYGNVFTYVRDHVSREQQLEMLKTVDQWPSSWAYWWALEIGDKEIMRDRVIESQWAYYWACDLGDKEIMRDRVTESKWVKKWNNYFNDNLDYTLTLKEETNG